MTSTPRLVEQPIPSDASTWVNAPLPSRIILLGNGTYNFTYIYDAETGDRIPNVQSLEMHVDAEWGKPLYAILHRWCREQPTDPLSIGPAERAIVASIAINDTWSPAEVDEHARRLVDSLTHAI